MLVLDATTKSIVATMSGAATTTNPSFVTAYSDNTGSVFTEGSSDGALNGTNSVTLVAAPASSTRRLVKTIYISNIDTAAVTLTISYNDNATLRQIVKVTLQVGDTWSIDGTTDNSGSLKTTVGSVNLSSVTNTLAVANGGTGLTSFTANGVVYASSTSALTTGSGLTYNGTVLTSGNFIPSSATVPTNGIYYPSTNTIGISSNSQASAYINATQIGSTGKYYTQLSLGTTTDTALYENLYVYQAATAANQCSSSDNTGAIYTFNGSLPFSLAQCVNSYSSYQPSATYTTIGLSAFATGNGNSPTQNATGVFQKFPAIGIYANSDAQIGNQTGTAYFGVANSYYGNGTAYYARTRDYAPTSGYGYCFRADIGSHVFSGLMAGLFTRIVSGTGQPYAGSTGWYHVDETPSGQAQYAAQFVKNGNLVGSITLGTSSTTYNTSSDPRLKNITGLIEANEAKSFVMALQPKKGTWKKDGSIFQGFVSTDYELVDPSAVNGVAGATEILGKIIDKDGKILNEDVVNPQDLLPEGARWEQTHIKDIYQTVEYGSAAWCANMTAHAQSLQATITSLTERITALEK